MNRKDRRAALKRNKLGATPDPAANRAANVDDLAAEARRLFNAGRLTQAQAICREVVARVPAHVEGLNLLGLIAQAFDRHAVAVRLFEKAIASDPDNDACHYNIGLSYQAMGRRDRVATHFRAALGLGMGDNDIGRFILERPAVAECLDRIAAARPARLTIEALFGPRGMTAIADDIFLRYALETTRIAGVAVETFLTELRHALLQAAAAAAPDFGGIADDVTNTCAALAQQCFLNESVYAEGEEETRQAAELSRLLQEKLRAATGIPPFLVAIVAAYRPLHALADAGVLLQQPWPDAIDALLRQQVREPRAEAQDRDAIPAITAIADGVSAQVRAQYEENPYPRWTVIPRAAAPGSSRTQLRADSPSDILIAGCGTGHQSIATALCYPNAKILAVDLSLSALAYARRKTREAALQNIAYAHADIMHLGGIGRDFDRIEASGVLHHLSDPKAGWRVLLSLLRPGGVMTVGLYSAIARRTLNAARALVREREYRATPQDIRACRQEFIRREPDLLRQEVTTSVDFYSMSECRDLLFHVMEHQFSIAEIKSFLEQERLTFLGFDVDDATRSEFQRQFPGAETDLGHWEAFEAANPQTFRAMYLFHVQSAR